jgi:hypothetical protein
MNFHCSTLLDGKNILQWVFNLKASLREKYWYNFVQQQSHHLQRLDGVELDAIDVQDVLVQVLQPDMTDNILYPRTYPRMCQN